MIMRMRHAGGSGFAFADILAPVFVFAVSMFFCALLHRAFPYGIVTSDTDGYLAEAQNFHVFAANVNDWTRTFPFGFILRFALTFAQPTVVVFWIFSCLFSAAIASTAWLGRILFGSMTQGMLVALLLLLLEIGSMHSYFYTLYTIADSFFAFVLFIAAVCILGGWISAHRAVFLLGFFLAGVAAMIRPVGMDLFFIWIPFTLYVAYTRSFSHRVWIACISLVLLLAPATFWSARNAMLYGYFETTASLGSNLLPTTLPLLQDTDVVLPQPDQNRSFITSIRTFQKTVGTRHDDYAWAHRDSLLNPFGFLQNYIQTYSPHYRAAQTDRNQMTNMFTLDATATDVAKRLIIAHPLGYLSIVANVYRCLLGPCLGPLAVPSIADNPYADLTQHVSVQIIRRYYPAGIDIGLMDPTTLSFFSAMTRNPWWSAAVFVWRMDIGWIAIHVFLACLIGILLWAAICRKQEWQHIDVRIFVCMLVLTLITLLNAFCTALMEIPIVRYTIPGGLSIHLACVLLFGIVVMRLSGRRVPSVR